MRCSEVNHKQLSFGYCISERDLIRRRAPRIACFNEQLLTERGHVLFTLEAHLEGTIISMGAAARRSNISRVSSY